VASPPPAQAQPAAASESSAAISADEPSAGKAGRAGDAAEERRLPIYDAVESDWFGNRRKLPTGSAAAGGGWTTPADPGWGAAQAAVAPVSSGTTTAGLPVRVPRANLVPGTAGGAQPDKAPDPPVGVRPPGPAFRLPARHQPGAGGARPRRPGRGPLTSAGLLP